MKLRRFFAAVLCAALAAVPFSACASSGSGPSAPVPASSAASALSGKSGGMLPAAPVEITFWHSMTGSTSALLDRIAGDYNNSLGAKNGVTVKMVYQGAYDEASTKLAAVLQAGDTGELPDLMQMSSKGIFDMKDSKFLYPVQNFTDQDPDGIDIDALNPNALHYAMYHDKILGLPFSNSSIMLYYNKDMFKAAGLDPEKAPATLEELADYTQKLTVRSGNKIKVFGLATKLRFFLLGTWIPMQGEGKYIFDNKDGRSGTPAKLAMTTDGTLDHLLTEWQKVLATGGVAYNEASPNEGFQGKMYAMITASTSSMASLVTKIQDTGMFDLGVAELPRIDAGCTPGTGIGGSAVYAFNTGSNDKLLGAWDFLKYLATPEVSGQWFINTGYYAMNSKAYEQPDVKKYLEEKPTFNIILQIAEHSKNYPDYLEPWVPSFTDIDTAVQNEIVQMSDGKQDRATTIGNIEAKVNTMLQDWHDANS